MKNKMVNVVVVWGLLTACGVKDDAASSKTNWVVCENDSDCGSREVCSAARCEVASVQAQQSVSTDAATPAGTDASSDMGPISPESNPDLFESESSIVGNWIQETELPYTTYLRIDGSSGYSCNNDGKSVSAAVELVSGETGVYLRFVPGHGEGNAAFERVQLDTSAEVLTLEGDEKGEIYTRTFRRGERPDVCQRLEDGDEVSFEELEASWEPVEE